MKEIPNWMEQRKYFDEPFTKNLFGEELYIVGEIPAQPSIRPCYIIWQEVDGEISESYLDKESLVK